MDPEELAQKEEREQERRQTQAQRLREMTSRKRLEKVNAAQVDLESWFYMSRHALLLWKAE